MKIIYDCVGDTLSILLSEAQTASAEEHGVVIINYNKMESQLKSK